MPQSRDSIADEYARGVARMRTFHDGGVMLEAAQSVLAALPPAPVCLLSTSLEGTALAAVVAAIRRDQKTCWERVTFNRPAPVPHGYHAVVVEPEDGGDGWRQALEDRYPGAAFVIRAARSSLALTA